VGANSALFAFRKTQCFYNPFEGVASFVSAGVSASIAPGSLNASGDLIIGAIKFKSFEVPAAFLGYLTVDVAAQVNNWTAFNISTSVNTTANAGFILKWFAGISERMPNGTIPKVLGFEKVALSNQLFWLITDVQFNSNGTGGISSITWTGKPILGNWSIDITFIISDRLGQVKVGAVSAAVSPKHVESFIEVKNIQLEDPLNNVRLHFGVLTGSASGQHSSSVTIATGVGSNQVYAHFSSQVDVAGQVKSVTINKTAIVDLSTADASLKASAQAVYGASIALYSVEVNFPPGALSFTYDPSMGAGTPVQAVSENPTTGTQTGSAATFIFSVLMVVIAILF
jgi:hypothetical protein